MPAIDLHQHLWPEPLVDLLRGRTRTPYLRGWTLHTDGEPAYDVARPTTTSSARIALDREAGVGLACVSLSAPLGIESLPRDEAAALIDAWHHGAAELPAHFAAWASVPVVEPDLDELAGLLAGAFVGVQLPATQLATPADWRAVGDVLRVAELAGKPVFVHPGPVDGGRPRRRGGPPSSGTSRSCRPPGGAGTRSAGGCSSRGCAWCSRPVPGWRRCSTSASPRVVAGWAGRPAPVRRDLVLRTAGASTPWSARSAST